jgi:2-polyprenyl-3-methyl-5-hydroxy-6-metoxy-1,4-benzoquinol methylase
MNKELRSCPGCDAQVYENILTLSPVHFVPLNHSYRSDVVEVLGLDRNEHFPIVRCRLCGFQYSLYLLKSELLDNLYNQCIDLPASQSKIYKAYKRNDYLHVWSRLFNLWLDGKGDETLDLRLLDYGCGWGDFMLTAQMPGLTCIGLEYDQRKVSYVRELGFHVVDSLDDLDQLAPLDLFFCNQVLEHVPEPKMVIRRINGCLAMGAYGFVGVPDFASHCMKEVVNAFREGSLVDKNVNPWEHLNYFSPATLVKMLEEAGFRVILPSKQDGSLSFSMRGISDLWSIQKTSIGEGVRRFFKKNRSGTHSCIPNSTTLYVQKTRQI